MELLVAYENDPAGHNMAKFLSKEMTRMEIFFVENIMIY